jgi:hypothetical protein
MDVTTNLRAGVSKAQRKLRRRVRRKARRRASQQVTEQDWATHLEQRFGTTPWWVVSSVLHALLFLLATLVAVALPPAKVDEVTIISDIAKEKPPEYDPKKKRDIFRNPQEVEHENRIDNPVVVHEQTEISDHFETDNDAESHSARGQENAISDIPLGGTGVTGVVGVGGGGMAGCFGYRDGGGRKKAVKRFGGSPATESAVEAALRWLARHQEKQGYWPIEKHYQGFSYWDRKREFKDEEARKNFEERRKKSLARMAERWKGKRIGVTGLAMLAFLGAGYTHKSGKFKSNVERAARWLVAQQQKKSGEINSDTKQRYSQERPYNHAIATLALAEAYGMTKDPALKEPAQKAVDCILEWQNPYSGWRYRPRDKQVDISVTGWMVMALKSARIAGLKVDSAGFQGATKWLKDNTDEKEGYIAYTGKRHRRIFMGRRKGDDQKAGVRRPSFWSRWQSAVSVCMLCRLLMGVRRADSMLQKQARLLLTDLPDWEKSKNHSSHTEYYWYYGTLAMFQMGAKPWKEWNSKITSMLIKHQCKGGPLDGSLKDVDGSWDPQSAWARSGTRIYMTAINALTLEVYYRYLPLYTME